jgi:glucosamine 6-phosphate synthetase-like amidotransferase/phosphosugar isomerase protein
MRLVGIATSIAIAYEFARARDVLFLSCGPTFSIAMEGALS